MLDILRRDKNVVYLIKKQNVKYWSKTKMLGIQIRDENVMYFKKRQKSQVFI